MSVAAVCFIASAMWDCWNRILF